MGMKYNHDFYGHVCKMFLLVIVCMNLYLIEVCSQDPPTPPPSVLKVKWPPYDRNALPISWYFSVDVINQGMNLLPCTMLLQISVKSWNCLNSSLNESKASTTCLLHVSKIETLLLKHSSPIANRQRIKWPSDQSLLQKGMTRRNKLNNDYSGLWITDMLNYTQTYFH